MLGPIDYVIVGFAGNRFDGSILKELSKAIENNTIRIVDLLFIMKDFEGTVMEGEFEDQSAELQDILGLLHRDDDLPLLSDSDVEKIGQQMSNDTAAGVLVIEHLWAKGLKKSIMDAGGFLVADGRIHPEVVESAVAELQKSGK